MIRRKLFKPVLGTGIVLILGLLLVSFYSPENRHFEIVKNLDIYASLFKEINEYYVDEVNPGQLMSKGVESMLSELDPYTVYISEDKIESFRTMSTGQYAGIGASTVSIDGKLFISMIYEGFSAYENGLKIGDEVVTVNGQRIQGLSQERLTQLIKGQVNTEITLEVIDIDTEQLKQIKFEREKVTIPNVPYGGMLDDDIAYIKFTEFTPNGYKNIKSKLQKLMKDGAKGVILDLRGNLGGLLDEAVDISNLFIETNLEVVHTKGKVDANSFIRKTKYKPLAPDLPLVILVDQMSASASEIVAGTMQDYDRAVLIGQKTYGKGLVQNTRDLPYNSKVKITIAKYYIPSGRCIQAINYSERNQDGTLAKVPDSLKVAFKTKNGRTVYDGGGIDPEIIVEGMHPSSFGAQLINQGLIFQFANKFKRDHQEISSARSFDLDEKDYLAFGSYVQNSGFVYRNPLNDELQQLKKKALELADNDKTKQLLEAIDAKINASLEDLLAANKKEISALLEVEIASRYYMNAGSIEAGLGDDPAVAQSIEVLNDQNLIDSLLATPLK
jgi:carboxyl-terminal processing protease